MTDQAYRVGDAHHPVPEPAQDQQETAPAGPRASSHWTLAYALVVATGGELAVLFGAWPGMKAWSALALYCTVVVVLGLLASGALRIRPRRSR